MKKVLIKDIAKKAGVSNATVSLVLNGKEKEGRVGKKVSDNVRKIAAEMNYQPDILARSLKSGKTQTIGLIVADITNPFFSHLAYYIEDEMEQKGYTVMIMNTNENDLRLEKIINMLKNRRIDGYIIVPTESGKPYIHTLIESGLPVVLVDRYFPDLQSYTVVSDGYEASFRAARLLIDRGCRKLGLIIYEGNQSHMSDRKSGFMDALDKAGLFNAAYICPVSFTNIQADVYEAMTFLISQKVEGVLFATNSISLWGIRTLMDNGVRIPEEIQIVCFDKSETFEFMPYPIPYIQQPIEVMARKAAELLVEQMEGNMNDPQTCKYPARLEEKAY